MSNVQTPSTELPGLRKLTPKERAQRAAAYACLSSEGKPGCTQIIWTGMFFDGTHQQAGASQNQQQEH